MAQSLWATDYYVDASNGNDSNNGLSPSAAWRTLGKVYNAMWDFNPGDRILFQRGETWGSTTPLSITCSGSSGNPITFGAYGTGAKPAFNGSSMNDPPINARPAVSHVTIQDIYIHSYSGTGIFFGDHGWDTNITISNCEVNGGSNGIFIDRTDTYIIEDCTVHNCSNGGIVIYGSPSQQATNGIIRNCTAYDIGQDGIVIHRDGSYSTAGPNHYIYNCLAYNCGEQGFDITAGSNIIVRNCISHDNATGSIAPGHSVDRIYIESFYSYDEDRYSIYIEDINTAVVVKSIVENPVRTCIDIRDDCDDVYLAHNTLIHGADASRSILGISRETDYPNNVVTRNNIFTENVDTSIQTIIHYYSPTTATNISEDSDYNRFWRIGESSSSLLFNDLVAGYQTLAARQSTHSQGANSTVGDPSIDYPTYELQSGSSCINAGTWLTTITSATGSGTSFVVNDANWFHNGFGVTTGSEIQLEGQSTPVIVTNINYSTNTITVNQNVYWAQGDGVAFAYSGYAPDMGAVEYEQGGPSSLSASASASPTSGTAPLSVNFTGSASGGTSPYSYSWNFDDGGSSTAQNPSHAFTSAGTYTVTLTVTDNESNQDSDTVVISVANPTNPLAASASGSPTSGTAPLAVNFTGSISGGTSPYSYSWNFGDGGSSTAQNPSHAYSNAGTFIAILTVTDSSSSQTTDSLTINVSSSAGTQQLLLSTITGGPAPGFGGTTDPTPGNHNYASGSFVALSAIPNTDYRFSEWEGDVNALNVYNPQFSLNLDTDKDLSAFFCTRCGDVNGDLTVTASDAQGAFDIFLSRNSSPTKCETENADVSCDSLVTPADAQAIFNKFIMKGELPADCSGKTRALQAQSLSIQTTQLPGTHLIVDDAQVNSNGYVYVPIIIDNPSNIDAFGFDLQFPIEVMEFLTFDVTGLLDEFNQVDAYYTEEGLLRVGGYSGTPLLSDSPEVLITLVFRVKDEATEPLSLVITNTYDDIKNATVKDGTVINKVQRERIQKRFERLPTLLFIRF